MNRILSLLILLGCCLGPRTLAGQGSCAEFSLSSAQGDPGDSVVLEVSLEPFCSPGIDGWAFGLCRPQPGIGIASVDHGGAIAILNNGLGPAFFSVDYVPGSADVGVVLDFLGQEILPPGDSYHVHDVAITLVGSQGNYPVNFCELENPLLVSVSGVFFAPNTRNGSVQINGNQAVEECETVDIPIFDFAATSGTTSISQGPPTVGNVGVLLDISHPRRGDLKVTLTSPEGSTVTIVEPNPLDLGADIRQCFVDFGCPYAATDFLSGYTPVSAPFGDLSELAGEDPFGTWTLTVTDSGVGQTGVVNDWCLKLWDETQPTETCCMSGLVSGDCNTDGGFDISDAVALIDYLFQSDPPPLCVVLCDVNEDFTINIADIVHSLMTLFN